MSISPNSLADWAKRLHALAESRVRRFRLSDPPVTGAVGTAFVDEMGHARAIDPYLVAAVAPQIRTPPPPDEASPIEVRVWSAGVLGRGVVESMLTPVSGGPLLEHASRVSVEVFTETELIALHALWTTARLRCRADLRERALSAASWHLETLQPDNATHLPWAIHVFAVLGVERGNPGATLDAETRLHNALTARSTAGQPDLRSALILEHAAMELDVASSSGTV